MYGTARWLNVLCTTSNGMIEFSYEAKNNNGDILKGKIEAPSEKIAVDILHSRGYVVVSLALIGKGAFSVDIHRLISRPGNKDIVVFTRQLATLVDADMPTVMDGAITPKPRAT